MGASDGSRVRGVELPQITFSLHTNYCDLGFCLPTTGAGWCWFPVFDNLLKEPRPGRTEHESDVRVDEEEGLA